MLRPSDGIAVRNIGGQQSVSLLPAESGRHPFKVTAVREISGETINWWLAIEEGFVRWNSFPVAGIIANGSGVVTYAAGLSVSADALSADETIQDAKIEKVHCYKAKRYGTNLLKQNQYKADGNTLVFAYTTSPGGPTPKLGVTSVDVFNSHFCPGVNGGFTCTPIIGIKPGGIPGGGTTEWRRICLNILPIALFNQYTGKVTQYVRDTIDMTVTYETASTYTYEGQVEGETTEEFATRINLSRKWGAYYYQTGASGAPTGYTFET